jgi:hypothetical protein
LYTKPTATGGFSFFREGIMLTFLSTVLLVAALLVMCLAGMFWDMAREEREIAMCLLDASLVNLGAEDDLA